MAAPTPQQRAEQHLSLVWNEIERLRERFQQRPKDEKKRLGALEKLLPKVKRLAKSLEGDALSKDDQALIDSLVPKKS